MNLLVRDVETLGAGPCEAENIFGRDFLDGVEGEIFGRGFVDCVEGAGRGGALRAASLSCTRRTFGVLAVLPPQGCRCIERVGVILAAVVAVVDDGHGAGG